ncbi:MAG: hypothetical protein ACRED8_01460 [Caulobacteraceae bacterium]
MPYSTGDLEMARRHVAEGEQRIGRQQALIERLDAGGHPTGVAHELLDALEDVIELMRAHLIAIEADLSDRAFHQKLDRALN